MTYGYWSGLQTDGYEWNFRPGAASGLIPTNDGQACVFASASPRRIGRGGLAPLTQIVADSSADLADRLAAAGPPSALRTFAGDPATCADHGDQAGPSSATPATSRIRSRRTGSPMRCAELLARGITTVIGGADERDALVRYQMTRDALSIALFDVMDVIAGHRWTDEEIPGLLLQLNAAMAGEVQALAALSPLPGPSDQRRAVTGHSTQPLATAGSRQTTAVPSRTTTPSWLVIVVDRVVTGLSVRIEVTTTSAVITSPGRTGARKAQST